MATSDAKNRANAKYSRENFQHISFKARIGSRDRIQEAAKATGQTVNGFIRSALSKAMMEAIGKPLEPTGDEFSKAMLLRLLSGAMASIFAFDPDRKTYSTIEAHMIDLINNTPELYEDITEIWTSDSSAKAKTKAFDKLACEKLEAMEDVIMALYENARLGR